MKTILLLLSLSFSSTAGLFAAEPFTPDLSKIWASIPARYGDINFKDGHYGDEGTPLLIEESYWDDGANGFVAIGTWGPDGNGKSGRFRFVFTTPYRFQGDWWYGIAPFDPNKSYSNWAGKIKE